MRIRACLAGVLLSVLTSSASFAQNTFFEESFDGGIPPTWSNIHLGSSSDVWLPSVAGVNGTPCVYHEYFCDFGATFRDNILLSPPIDLSGLSQASFFCEQVQGFASSIFYNKIEVTADGGQSYTVIKDLAGSPEGYSTVLANMDAFAGMPSVQVALHYKGSIANDWWVDNVRVLTPNPVFTIRHLVAGSTARFGVRGVPAGSTVVMGISSGPGPTSTPYGPLNMSFPITRLPRVVADLNGEAFYDLSVPQSSSGSLIYSQAVVFFPGGGFDRSNSLARVVQ